MCQGQQTGLSQPTFEVCRGHRSVHCSGQSLGLLLCTKASEAFDCKQSYESIGSIGATVDAGSQRINPQPPLIPSEQSEKSVRQFQSQLQPTFKAFQVTRTIWSVRTSPSKKGTIGLLLPFDWFDRTYKRKRKPKATVESSL